MTIQKKVVFPKQNSYIFLIDTEYESSKIGTSDYFLMSFDFQGSCKCDISPQ